MARFPCFNLNMTQYPDIFALLLTCHIDVATTL